MTSTASGRLAVAEWAESTLAESGFGLESDGRLVQSDLRGRRALAATPDGSILVRRFTHGGLLRCVSRRRFLDAQRPFAELALAVWLASRGIPTPRVAAARARAAFGFGHELALATERIHGARDVESLLVEVRARRCEREPLRPVLRAAGEFVRSLHALGFLHADLTPKNLLVESRASATPRLWVIDLDRSRLEVPLRDASRRDNLRRLWRFVDRRERGAGQALGVTDVARFLVAYEPERRARHALWRAIASEHARHAFWHRLAWTLDRGAGIERAGRAASTQSAAGSRRTRG